MEKIKSSLLFLSIIIISILLFKSCNKSKNDNNSITNTDTTIIHTRDTIYAKDTMYMLIGHPRVVDSLFIHDTINPNPCDYIRTYKDTLEDSNLTIYSDYLIKGSLIGSGNSYKLKVPLIIYDSTKTTITASNELKMGLYGGLEGGYKSFSPYLDFKLRKLDLGVSYDLYNKTPKVRVGYRIISK